MTATISLDDIEDGFRKNLSGKLTDKQKYELTEHFYNNDKAALIEAVETLLKQTLDLQRALIKKKEL